MGIETYHKVHKIITENRRLGTEELAIQAEIKEAVGKNRQLQQLCFQLDQLIFMELLS